MSRWITSPHQIAARERWIKDLQTTKALQGTGALKTVPSGLPPQYCCLGRAIDCQPQNTFGLEDYVERTSPASPYREFLFKTHYGGFNSGVGTIPQGVFCRLFGLHPTAASIILNHCITYNDNNHLTFPEIAERLPALFYFADTCEEFK